jgi:heme/copper-type cytochrome/quinol oxidase subunit 3
MFGSRKEINIIVCFLLFSSAAGRYCEWQHITVDKSSDIETFEDYKKTLKLECEHGEASVLNWTVSQDTPDLVYYQVWLFMGATRATFNLLPLLSSSSSSSQCYTHNNLGWKIKVVPSGTTSKRNGASRFALHSTIVLLISSFAVHFANFMRSYL